MLFVELGREVSPRNLKHRHHRAVITGIKNQNFVVVLKQDGTHEVVRLKEVVLNDKLYDLEDLEQGGFFRAVEKATKGNDFDRFKGELERRVVEELANRN